MPAISIIIPTLNEVDILPKLLESIKQQEFTDYEVIVSDAGSTDGTVKIAEEYGARVVKGGMPGPGRNRGAEKASGRFLFFLDADVKLPKDFLENARNEMEEQYIDLATCEIRPLSNLTLDRVIHNIMNTGIRLNLKVNPSAFGFNIFVTKRLFERVGGFDESIRVAEDADFVNRASKFRSLEYLESVYINVSVRRFRKEGRFGYANKGIQIFMHRLLKGEIRGDEIDYDFDNFDEKNSDELSERLRKIDSMLIKLERDFRSVRKKVKNTGEVIRETNAFMNREGEKTFKNIGKMLKNLPGIKK
jgi:glycosyltransferase involved in cell wall biosynthesis